MSSRWWMYFYYGKEEKTRTYLYEPNDIVGGQLVFYHPSSQNVPFHTFSPIYGNPVFCMLILAVLHIGHHFPCQLSQKTPMQEIILHTFPLTWIAFAIARLRRKSVDSVICLRGVIDSKNTVWEYSGSRSLSILVEEWCQNLPAWWRFRAVLTGQMGCTSGWICQICETCFCLHACQVYPHSTCTYKSTRIHACWGEDWGLE